MEMLLELILIGSVIVGVGFLVNRFVNSKFGDDKEVKPTPEPVRARNEKGHFISDDPTTPDVNEAWVDGKAPVKPKKKKTTKKKAIRKTPTKPKSKQTK